MKSRAEDLEEKRGDSVSNGIKIKVDKNPWLPQLRVAGESSSRASSEGSQVSPQASDSPVWHD